MIRRGREVRVDSIAQTAATTTEVVFSVLVGDSVALDHIQGDAVRTDDQWLVSPRRRRAGCSRSQS
jgi:hypothetical protein